MIEIKSVTKLFGKKRALNNISFAVSHFTASIFLLSRKRRTKRTAAVA